MFILRQVISTCHSTGAGWFNALIYQGMENGELYVREYKDFFDKFVKLLDWENGTKETKESGQC